MDDDDDAIKLSHVAETASPSVRSEPDDKFIIGAIGAGTVLIVLVLITIVCVFILSVWTAKFKVHNESTQVHMPKYIPA